MLLLCKGERRPEAASFTSMEMWVGRCPRIRPWCLPPETFRLGVLCALCASALNSGTKLSDHTSLDTVYKTPLLSHCRSKTKRRTAMLPTSSARLTLRLCYQT